MLTMYALILILIIALQVNSECILDVYRKTHAFCDGHVSASDYQVLDPMQVNWVTLVDSQCSGELLDLRHLSALAQLDVTDTAVCNCLCMDITNIKTDCDTQSINCAPFRATHAQSVPFTVRSAGFSTRTLSTTTNVPSPTFLTTFRGRTTTSIVRATSTGWFEPVPTATVTDAPCRIDQWGAWQSCIYESLCTPGRRQRQRLVSGSCSAAQPAGWDIQSCAPMQSCYKNTQIPSTSSSTKSIVSSTTTILTTTENPISTSSTLVSTFVWTPLIFTSTKAATRTIPTTLISPSQVTTTIRPPDTQTRYASTEQTSNRIKTEHRTHYTSPAPPSTRVVTESVEKIGARAQTEPRTHYTSPAPPSTRVVTESVEKIGARAQTEPRTHYTSPAPPSTRVVTESVKKIGARTQTEPRTQYTSPASRTTAVTESVEKIVARAQLERIITWTGLIAGCVATSVIALVAAYRWYIHPPAPAPAQPVPQPPVHLPPPNWIPQNGPPRPSISPPRPPVRLAGSNEDSATRSFLSCSTSTAGPSVRTNSSILTNESFTEVDLNDTAL